MKKCLILLLMLLMCLSGCGTLSQSDEISIVLLHGWGTMEEDNQAMREIYSEFEKDNPDISLKLISMSSPENVTSKVKEMISVGKLPNLIYIGETGIDTLYSFMVTQGYVIDIMPYIEKDKEFQSMIAPETLMKWKTADGKLYTVTDVLNTGGYWYNKQIFENAKIQKTPENWKEFLECCKKIKQWAEQEKLDTVSMHLDYNTIECMMQSYIGGTDSDEKSISEALKLLNEIKDYADVEKNYTYRDRLRSFNVGHSAIYAGGIASEQKINPKLKMEYAMFPDKNNKDVAMVSAYPGYFIGSSSDTKQKEACIRFLKYMLSEKVQTKIWKKTGQIPSNPSVNIADLSGQNDVIYEAYAKLKKADIVRELPGNDWDFEQREDFEANIFRYLSGDISEDEIVDSLKSK